MITFKCESCGVGLRLTDAMAGKMGKCPKCGHALQVPFPAPGPSTTSRSSDCPSHEKSDIGPVPSVASQTSTSNVSYAEPRPATRRVRIVALAAIMIFICAAAIAMYVVFYPHKSLTVIATRDQIAIWNAFRETRKASKSHPVVFYTRKDNPIMSLSEITGKKQFAIYGLYKDCSDVSLKLFGYESDDLVGLSIRGGGRGTLDDPLLRIYLGYEACEREYASYGWIPICLVAE